MKNLTLFFLGLLSPAMAQMAPQPLPQVEHLQGKNYLFSWEGVPGRMYFIQTSSSLAANEFDWEFAPDIRVGTGSQIEMGFQANAAHFEFFRLVYNDLSEGEDANLKDNDGDGFTNLEEAIANTNPNSAQSYPGSSGNTGGGNSGGSSGSGTTWNHPWEYKLTYKVEGSTIKEDFINPHNDVGLYDYDLEVGYETEITFKNIEGDNKVTFLQLEPDLSSSSSSNGWKSKGVVELSKQNPNWSNDDDPQGTGAFGLLLPVEITIAFGEGPDTPPNAGNQNSRELLEAYLDGIIVARQGDVWAVNGKDAQGNDKIWGVEIVSDQAKLNAALSSGGRYVVFDGHSNFGLGPDFGGINITEIADLTNYGVRYTDVPLNFRLRGPVNDPTKWGDPFTLIQVGDNEIPAAPTNDKPLPINEERFPNIDGVGVGQAFQKYGQGFDTWHYRIQGGAKRLMIDAPNTDLPANLAYKTFFYNACNTGIDYIENFKKGDFIYTKESCFVHQATNVFVQGVVEGKTTKQIMPLLNVPNVGGGGQGEIIYEFKRFKP